MLGAATRHAGCMRARVSRARVFCASDHGTISASITARRFVACSHAVSCRAASANLTHRRRVVAGRVRRDGGASGTPLSTFSTLTTTVGQWWGCALSRAALVAEWPADRPGGRGRQYRSRCSATAVNAATQASFGSQVRHLSAKATESAGEKEVDDNSSGVGEDGRAQTVDPEVLERYFRALVRFGHPRQHKWQHITGFRASLDFDLTDEEVGTLPVIEKGSPYSDGDDTLNFHSVADVAELYRRKHGLSDEVLRSTLAGAASSSAGAGATHDYDGTAGAAARPVAMQYDLDGLPTSLKARNLIQRHAEEVTRQEQIQRAIAELRRVSRAKRRVAATLAARERRGAGAVPPASQVVGSKSVRAAIIGNGALFVAKVVAFAASGSASMLSEAVHSLSDFANQILLMVGIVQSQRPPDAAHPYGYHSERFVWSLISGVGVFFLGCGVSVYHGINGLLHPAPLESLPLALSVLATAFAVEGYTGYVAYKEIVADAVKKGMSFKEYLKRGPDPMSVAVFAEDTAAVIGVMVAGTCLTASHITGNPVYDSVGSIVVGGILGGVAFAIVQKSRDMLIGRTIASDRVARVQAVLEAQDSITSVHDVKATILGANEGRLKAELNFNAAFIGLRAMELQAARYGTSVDNLPDVYAVQSGEEHEERLVEYSADVLRVLGQEVDRLERLIRTELPELVYVDLELL